MICFYASGKYHLRFNEERKFNELENIDISKSIPLKCKAKVRYRDVDHSCQILSSNEDECYIKFDNEIKAITTGQSIVLYNEHGVCIGGGIIRKRNIPFLGEELKTQLSIYHLLA